MSNEVWHEFYCGWCPDGGTYIRLRLDMVTPRHIEVICPLCGSRHWRKIENGQLLSRKSYHPDVFVETHRPAKAVCSKEPKELPPEVDVNSDEKEKARQQFIRRLWQERFGGGQ